MSEFTYKDIVDKKVYTYNEDKYLKELQDYILNTYKQHYSKNKFQSTQFILDSGHGEGFCIGNIMKYAQRFGKKNGKNRNDLLKILHYGMIALYNLDMELNNETK
jgi:hypothetical protein